MAQNRKPPTVAAAAALGYRELLEAIRNDLAAALDAAEPSVKAQIAGQLRAIAKDLAEMAPPEVSASDDLAAKRARRRATPDAGAPAATGGKQRRPRSG